MSLYLFEGDEGADGSTCTDRYAEAWPPFTTEGEPVAGQAVDDALLGTIEREGRPEQSTAARDPPPHRPAAE